MLIDVLFNVIPVTRTVDAVTVTIQVALFPLPSFAVAVIVAVPGATAVINPLELTVATDAFDVVQFSPLLVAFEGDTVALS